MSRALALLLLFFLFFTPLITHRPSADQVARKLLIYYGYPSLFNGSSNAFEVSKLFDRYVIVILGDDLSIRGMRNMKPLRN
ncbi:MAG: hypothetical protein NZ992_08140 [Candidatus Korarchaeum sp.]|nr:hypothetical protein [Candidatus Korarchaeum sp.]MDW8035925.1 hypothetical protein [Candidatus Korarchaeum sp.]